MQDTASDGLEFRNPGRRLLQGGLIGGGLCVAYGGVAGAIVGLSQLPTNDGAGLFWAVSGIFAGSISVTMFLLAGLSLFVARATDRVIAQFRNSQALADWRYPDAEWEAFVAAAQTRRSQGRAWLAALGVVLPIGIFAVICVSVASPRVWVGAAILTLIAAGTALLLLLLRRIVAGFDRRFLARLRRNPRVLVGRSAVYCGGVLTVWDVNMTVLQRIRILPGPPMQLEVTVGPNRVLQAVDMVAGAATAASGGAGGGTASGMGTQLVVPVPAGREAEAAALVQALRHRSDAPATEDAAVPDAAAAVPGAAPRPLPAAARRPARRAPWWAIAAGLWVAGLVLFLAAPKAAGGGGQDFTPLGTAMSVVGLFLWIGSLLAAITAGVATLRAVRHRRQATAAR